MIKIDEGITREDDVDSALKAIEKWLREKKEDKFFNLYPVPEFELKVKIGVDKELNFTVKSISSS